MKMNAVVAGVGMTNFGKHLERGLKSLGGEAVEAALADAGLAKSERRPGGRATGVYAFLAEGNLKRLELLAELLPRGGHCE